MCQRLVPKIPRSATSPRTSTADRRGRPKECSRLGSESPRRRRRIRTDSQSSSPRSSRSGRGWQRPDRRRSPRPLSPALRTSSNIAISFPERRNPTRSPWNGDRLRAGLRPRHGTGRIRVRRGWDADPATDGRGLGPASRGRSHGSGRSARGAGQSPVRGGCTAARRRFDRELDCWDVGGIGIGSETVDPVSSRDRTRSGQHPGRKCR